MIIFYAKKTGEITGSIDGRIHPPEHHKMWIGSEDDTERHIIEWKKEGDMYVPDTKQKELAWGLDSKKKNLYDYKIDIKSRRLIKK